MKYIILLFYIIVGSTAFAQISVGPIVGLRQSYVYPVANTAQFNIENIFKPNLAFGVKSDFYFSNDEFKITLQSAYSEKSARAYISGFLQLETINYYSINSSIFLNKSLFSDLYLGVGFSHSYIPYVSLNYVSDIHFLYEKKHDFGIIGSLNYNFKNFILDFNYVYAVKTNSFHKNNIEKWFEPISFMQLQIGYLFSINSTKNSKVQEN